MFSARKAWDNFIVLPWSGAPLR